MSSQRDFAKILWRNSLETNGNWVVDLTTQICLPLGTIQTHCKSKEKFPSPVALQEGERTVDGLVRTQKIDTMD